MSISKFRGRFGAINWFRSIYGYCYSCHIIWPICRVNSVENTILEMGFCYLKLTPLPYVKWSKESFKRKDIFKKPYFEPACNSTFPKKPNRPKSARAVPKPVAVSSIGRGKMWTERRKISHASDAHCQGSAVFNVMLVKLLPMFP